MGMFRNVTTWLLVSWGEISGEILEISFFVALPFIAYSTMDMSLATLGKIMGMGGIFGLCCSPFVIWYFREKEMSKVMGILLSGLGGVYLFSLFSIAFLGAIAP